MIKVYCRDCREFTPLAVEDMLKQPDQNIITGSLICPRCSSTLATLQVEEEGIYSFQKVADLEIKPSALQNKVAPSQRPRLSKRSSRVSDRLKLVP